MAGKLILGTALVFMCWAGWMDWRSRRIPNWLTVPGLVLGLLANGLAWGWSGAVGSLEGAGLGLALLLPFVLLRGLGAGDWKLAGALGAFLGWRLLIVVLLGAIFIAGIMAFVEMVRARRVKETLLNLLVLGQVLATFGIATHDRSHLTLDDPSRLKLPFGVALTISMMVFLGTQVALRIF